MSHMQPNTATSTHRKPHRVTYTDAHAVTITKLPRCKDTHTPLKTMNAAEAIMAPLPTVTQLHKDTGRKQPHEHTYKIRVTQCNRAKNGACTTRMQRPLPPKQNEITHTHTNTGRHTHRSRHHHRIHSHIVTEKSHK